MKYGVAAIIHGASSQGAEREACELIVAAIDELLKAGTATGALKPDLNADEVLFIVTFLWRLPPAPDIEQKAARMLDIVIDGLSPATHDTDVPHTSAAPRTSPLATRAATQR
jgi:hypothetical protein